MALIGQDIAPPDIIAKVTGKAKYAEDFRAEGMVFAKLLLSPMPHARVRSVDATEALAMPRASFLAAIISGKFHGMIWAQTPTGRGSRRPGMA